MAQAVHAWGDAKFSAEGAVEVRHIAETAIEGDVEASCRLRRQPHRRFTQARPQNVLVRCHTRQALERTEKVVWAEARLPRQGSEAERGIGTALDHAHASCHPRDGARWGAARIAYDAA